MKLSCASPFELEAEAHAMLARGHELLAAAARARREPVCLTAGTLVPVKEAARVAATSVRVLRKAILDGELAGFGGQRDRAVRPEDLERWIEARRLVLAGPADADIERRMRRLKQSRENKDG